MKEIGRIVILKRTERPRWFSLRAVEAGLVRAYREAFGSQAKIIRFGESDGPAELDQVVRAVREAAPDRIVFVDAPVPVRLILALRRSWASGRVPELWFHVEGSFSKRIPEWIAIESVLRSTRCALICASRRQGLLVQQFLREASGGGAFEVRCLPFPVDERLFRHDPAGRRRFRGEAGLGTRELAVGYSGRLTFQKNTVPLIREIARLMRRQTLMHLFLAGRVDESAAPIFGLIGAAGAYRGEIEAELDSLPETVRRRIHLMGFLGKARLADFYNGIDVFVSPGLMHDEDFGMSPAEALCCGTPVILTDWGGYASLLDFRQDASGLPVDLGARGLSVEYAALRHALRRRARAPGGARERGQRSLRIQGRLSIPAVAAGLRSLHQEHVARRFPGFSRTGKWLAALSRFPGAVPFPGGPKTGTFYERIYRPYLGTGGRKNGPIQKKAGDTQEAKGVERDLRFLGAADGSQRHPSRRGRRERPGHEAR